METIIIFLLILFVVWLRDCLTTPAPVRRSEAAIRARHRRAGTIGFYFILGLGVVFYGTILLAMSFR